MSWSFCSDRRKQITEQTFDTVRAWAGEQREPHRVRFRRVMYPHSNQRAVPRKIDPVWVAQLSPTECLLPLGCSDPGLEAEVERSIIDH